MGPGVVVEGEPYGLDGTVDGKAGVEAMAGGAGPEVGAYNIDIGCRGPQNVVCSAMFIYNNAHYTNHDY